METLAKPNKCEYECKTQVSSPTVSHLYYLHSWGGVLHFFHSPQQSRQFCDTVGELTMSFAFVFALVRLSKSRHRLFILS